MSFLYNLVSNMIIQIACEGWLIWFHGSISFFCQTYNKDAHL